MSRLQYSIKNIKYATIGQFAGLMISFVSRMVFVRTLNSEYLGINGLFTNILSMLSLAELGIGTAMVYSMYKPLADKNHEKLKTLMYLYKKAYIYIGLFIFVIGLFITPFLEYIIKDMPSIQYIYLIYILFATDTSISYFFSYKRSLIIADQKRYIATFYRYSFFFVLNVLQIIFLILTNNYFYFLALQIMSTLLENIAVSYKANRLYPFLLEKNISKLENEEKKEIIRNVKALMFHKIGSVVVLGTDNLLISKFVGIIAVGLYSNYLLIVNAFHMIFGLLFQSITASIGNLGVTETKQKQLETFYMINLVGFWIYSMVSIVLVLLFNPFIELWIGEEYLFSQTIILLIIINFYLTGMRKSTLTFKDALGLYWYDRYKPVLESIINFIASIILVREMGISGVFIGTMLSTILTCLWIEPLVLFKFGFKTSVLPYFKKYMEYTVLTIVVTIINRIICGMLPNYSLLGIITKLVVIMVITNVIFLIYFWRSTQLQAIITLLKSHTRGKSN